MAIAILMIIGIFLVTAVQLAIEGLSAVRAKFRRHRDRNTPNRKA